MPLTRRAVLRLELAADLLGSDSRTRAGWGIDVTPGQGQSRPEAVLERIRAMPKEEADRLQGLVDWVEEYERGESLPPAKAARPSPMPPAPGPVSPAAPVMSPVRAPSMKGDPGYDPFIPLETDSDEFSAEQALASVYALDEEVDEQKEALYERVR